MTQIKDVLLDFNTWWASEFNPEFKEREAYGEIKKFIPMPQIIALTGLRRVGKTTIMFKIVSDAIREGINPKNIMYFSFDEFKNTEIRQVLEVFQQIVEKDLGKEKFLILLDEVQKLTDWENQVKTFYDAFGKSVKIILSGSESLFLHAKSRETLAGRMFEFVIRPLSFKEFLEFKKMIYSPIGVHEKQLLKAFKGYTLTQGFPELVEVSDKEVIKKYLIEGIIDKIIYKDIPTLYKIRDIETVKGLLNILMQQPGQILDLNQLAKELSTSRQSISNYFTYLENAFLVKKLYNYSNNRRKTERKLKKYYSTIISVDLTFKDDSASQSIVFEWLLVNRLNAEFFWRDNYQNEVDVIEAKNEVKAIEIKYGKIDTKSTLVFMKSFKLKNAAIISLDKEQKLVINGNTIQVTPAYKYLLKND